MYRVLEGAEYVCDSCGKVERIIDYPVVFKNKKEQYSNTIPFLPRGWFKIGTSVGGSPIACSMECAEKFVWGEIEKEKKKMLGRISKGPEYEAEQNEARSDAVRPS